jgi:TDG/mug DNA glycosylase family protein
VKLSRSELDGFRGATLPDLLGAGTKLLFVGVNPGLRAAALQAPFAGSNRFYPALLAAGIVERRIDVSSGLSAEDRSHLVGRGVGITSLVAAATARADELAVEDLVAGVSVLAAKVARVRPAIVAVLGVTAYRAAFASPAASAGRQDALLAGCQLWVVPNPSGRNAHAPLPVLAAAYREAAIAAGLSVAASAV